MGARPKLEESGGFREIGKVRRVDHVALGIERDPSRYSEPAFANDIPLAFAPVVGATIVGGCQWWLNLGMEWQGTEVRLKSRTLIDLEGLTCPMGWVNCELGLVRDRFISRSPAFDEGGSPPSIDGAVVRESIDAINDVRTVDVLAVDVLFDSF